MKNKINNTSTDQDELQRFVKILSGLIVIIIALFLFTKYVVNDGDARIPERQLQEGVIVDNNVVAGTMFNRPDKEYYVFTFSLKSPFTQYYLNKVQQFMDNDKNLTMYLLNTDNELNKPYITDGDYTKSKTIDNLVLKEFSLIKIKNGKIVEYITETEKVKERLG